MRIPLHVVGGFLGTGKTTVLLAELSRREGRERCAVVVNDFGRAAIDATLLGGGVRVTNIPGGCVCCTAPEGLAPAVRAILDELKPDRIFVEPSGLGRPRDVVDMLSRGEVAHRIALGPTVVLVDPTRAAPDPTLFAEQLDAADVLVATRCDLADLDQLAAFDRMAAALWPPPLLVAHARQGVLPAAAWEWPAGAGPRAGEPGHDHDHDHEAAPGREDSTRGYQARSWVFPTDAVFLWDGLTTLLAGVAAGGVERFKGVFRTDLGWYRLDLAGGVVHPAATSYRRDSRADVILREGADLEAFAAGLLAARSTDRAPDTLDSTVLTLVDPSGMEIPLSRGALMAMPGQVPDVSVVAPGRAGSGVRLAELFALTRGGDRFVVVAGDGLTTTPQPIDGLGDSVIVHSLDGGPLPDDKGGPFRLWAAGASACANVKNVVRLRVLGDDPG
jgi:G3E family GTPase